MPIFNSDFNSDSNKDYYYILFKMLKEPEEEALMYIFLQLHQLANNIIYLAILYLSIVYLKTDLYK